MKAMQARKTIRSREHPVDLTPIKISLAGSYSDNG